MSAYNQHIRYRASMTPIHSVQSDKTWQMHEEGIMGGSVKKSRLYKRLKTALLRPHDWIRQWMGQKADMHRLRGMDERQLKDIGLSGKQIASSIEERIDFESRMNYRTKKRPPFS